MKNSKIVLFVLLGTAFWNLAACIIKFWGESVFSAGNPKLILFFFLAIPLTVASMYISAFIGKLKVCELLAPVVIMTITATFLDAFALVYFRYIYSESFEVAMHGAAWILWGAGVGLLLSFYLDIRVKKRLDEEI
jgi:hypothetical protein